jgi:hypothetical protein
VWTKSSLHQWSVLDGLSPTYAWEMLQAFMRVENELRRGVVFVGSETSSGFFPHGTGFLGVIVHEDLTCPFVIIARHVVDGISVDRVTIRLNRRDGALATIKLEKKLNIEADEAATDTVLLFANIDPAIYDVEAIKLDRNE